VLTISVFVWRTAAAIERCGSSAIAQSTTAKRMEPTGGYKEAEGSCRARSCRSPTTAPGHCHYCSPRFDKLMRDLQSNSASGTSSTGTPSLTKLPTTMQQQLGYAGNTASKCSG
jgi:hypothetical protein